LACGFLGAGLEVPGYQEIVVEQFGLKAPTDEK
jgi:hypothetical protein